MTLAPTAVAVAASVPGGALDTSVRFQPAVLAVPGTMPAATVGLGPVTLAPGVVAAAPTLLATGMALGTVAIAPSALSVGVAVVGGSIAPELAACLAVADTSATAMLLADAPVTIMDLVCAPVAALAAGRHTGGGAGAQPHPGGRARAGRRMRGAAMAYVTGDTVKLTCTFTVDGVPTAPDTQSLKVKDPSGNVDTYSSGFTNPSTGVYSKNLAAGRGRRLALPVGGDGRGAGRRGGLDPGGAIEGRVVPALGAEGG